MASEMSEPDTPRTPASGSRRAQKVQLIFEKFDWNKDGALSKEEMANLVIAVNPRVKFSEDQIKAILDEVFRTYGEFIIPDRGLSLDGLKRTYDDGAGDVDRDFEALNLQMGSIVGGFDTKKKPPRSMMSDIKIDIDDVESPAHEQTRKLLEDLQLLLRRHKVVRPPSGEGARAQQGQDPKELARGLAELRNRAERFTPLAEAFRAHMAMGHMLAQHAKHGEAITSFVKATILQENDVLAHFRAGNSYYAIGAINEAQASYERALLGDRNAPGEASKDLLAQVHTNLGIVLESQGLLFAASEHYQDAARLNQKHFRVLKLLGSAQLALGDLRDAKDALEHSLYLNADFAEAHMELASVLHQLGDHRAAKQEMMDALRLAPGDVDVKYNYGNLLRDMGDFKGAEKMYREVLKARPNDWKAMLNLAVALIGLDSTAEALTVLVAALHLEERIEIHDTIEHLKRLSRKKKSPSAALWDLEIAAEPSTSGVNGPDKDIAAGANGASPGFSSTFNQANGATPAPLELSQALEIRAFQRASHLDRVAPRAILQESTSALQQPVTKAQAELVLQRVLQTIPRERFPLLFPLAMRAFNTTILAPLFEANRDLVDLGIVLAVAALLAADGPAGERKQVAFRVLAHRSGRQGDQVPQADVYEFLRSLRTVLLPGAPLPGDGKEMGDVLLGFREFETLLDNPQSGLGVYGLLLRLEKPDKRHNAFCAFDEKRIVGMRFKETTSGFSLCAQSYCEGKVPKEFQDQSSFTFKVVE